MRVVTSLVLLSIDWNKENIFQFVLFGPLNTYFILPRPKLKLLPKCSFRWHVPALYCSVPLSSHFPLMHTLTHSCPRPFVLAILSAWNTPPQGVLLFSPSFRSLLQCHLLRELPEPPSLELHPLPHPSPPTPVPALFFSVALITFKYMTSFFCFLSTPFLTETPWGQVFLCIWWPL